MAADRLNDEQITKLGRDIAAKIEACRPVLRQAQGEIAIRAFVRGDGFDIKLTVTS